MKPGRIRLAIVTILTSFSLACVFSGLGGAGGPGNFAAKATSPDSVMLTWDAVADAAGYQVEVKLAGGNFLKIAELVSSQTSYEDFASPSGSQLTYRVSTVTASGTGGSSQASMTTSARTPNPLEVQVKLDQKSTATQKIGPEGGSVSLKDANGVQYKLDIPAGALTEQTEIKLTAVKDIGGWPLDGAMLAGVTMAPDGLQLLDPATLTIKLAGGLPSGKLSTLGFAFTGTGQEFHLEPVLGQNVGTSFAPQTGSVQSVSLTQQGSSTIVQFHEELQGSGVGMGSADSAGSLVRNNPPTDAGAAQAQKQAAALAEDDYLYFSDLTIQPKPTANQYDADASITASAVSLSIASAGDCGALHSAEVSFEVWRSRSQFDKNGALHPDQIDATEKAIMDDLAGKIKEIVDKTSEECKKNSGNRKTPPTAQAGCLESILDKIANPPQTGSGFWSELQTAMGNKLGNGVVADAQNKLNSCLPAYNASGGSNGYNFKGTICSLTKPFALQSSGMEHFDVTFTPSSSLSGNVAASGGGGPCTDVGSGAYLVNLSADGTGTIIATFPASTVTCAGVSKTNKVVQDFDITPLAEKPGSCSQP
jgi:hypothetical protein